MPANSQASVFSFVSQIFTPAKASNVAVENSANSQKINLLQPAINSDPSPSKGSKELAVSGDALLNEAGPEGKAGGEISRPSSDQISLYTVRENDNLSTIAKMFGVSVGTIRWANDLKANSSVRPGQVLVILPISGIKYTVKKGDTVQSIAKTTGGDVDDILSFNDLESSQKLTVGDEIIIPDGEPGEQNANNPGTVKKVVDKISKVVTSGGSTSGYFRRPIDIGVKSQGIHGHNGVDLAAPVGTPIHAAASGIVIVAKGNGGWNGAYGNYVVISHPNGTQTLYAHMKDVTVSVGEKVEQSELIGHIGMTGKTTGPHVHVEVHGGKNPF